MRMEHINLKLSTQYIVRERYFFSPSVTRADLIPIFSNSSTKRKENFDNFSFW